MQRLSGECQPTEETAAARQGTKNSLPTVRNAIANLSDRQGFCLVDLLVETVSRYTSITVPWHTCSMGTMLVETVSYYTMIYLFNGNHAC